MLNLLKIWFSKAGIYIYYKYHQNRHVHPFEIAAAGAAAIFTAYLF
jgi:hypothetical protein